MPSKFLVVGQCILLLRKMLKTLDRDSDNVKKPFCDICMHKRCIDVPGYLTHSLSRPRKISNYRINRYGTKYLKFKNEKTYKPILLQLSCTGKLWNEQRFVVFGSHNEHHIQHTIDRFVMAMGYNLTQMVIFMLFKRMLGWTM